MSKGAFRVMIPAFVAMLLMGLPMAQPTHAADKNKGDSNDKKQKDDGPKGVFDDKGLAAAAREQVFEKRGTDEPIVAGDVREISTIDAADLGIEALKGLQHARSLASLYLSHNSVKDLSPLNGLTELQLLDAAHNNVADLAPLSGLKNLQYLDASHNQVTSVAPLASLKRLNSLYLAHNKIKDVSALSGLDRLWSLYLNGNPIKSIKPLAKLEGLTTLDLRQTGVKDLAPIAKLRNLRLLMLDGNQIKDLGPLVKAARADAENGGSFAPFLELYIRNNPLSKNARQKQIETLESLGVKVVWQSGDNQQQKKKDQKKSDSKTASAN